MVLDGLGKRSLSTGIGFFDHMLDHLSKHSGISLMLEATGDLQVDFHHTVEDTGIVLGELLHEALGDGVGITRYGSASVPMEEALVEASLDLCGRGYLVYNVPTTQPKVGEFDSELAREFFLAFSRSGHFTLHINFRYGINQHHILEGAFKAVAQALHKAVTLTGSGEVPSTKGVL
jgi:imidazoleglycerol-phosphate dehydratase